MEARQGGAQQHGVSMRRGVPVRAPMNRHLAGNGLNTQKCAKMQRGQGYNPGAPSATVRRGAFADG